MNFPHVKERLSLQREMSLREVLTTDVVFVLVGILLAALLIIGSPLILLGLLGECEYS